MTDNQLVTTNSTPQRAKAIFVNGGAGRVLSSIPAIEKHIKTNPDSIVVCEGYDGFFKNHPTIWERTFHPNHKHLFRDYIKDRDIITSEPYRIWEYYNQKASLAQAFDLDINGSMEPNASDYKPNIHLTSTEVVKGQAIIQELKEKSGHESFVVLQPFGASMQVADYMMSDGSGRSFGHNNTIELITKISEWHGVILMSEVELTMPEGIKVGNLTINLREWAAVIKAADHFVGCDSVGQHLAYSMDTPSTVVLSGTFPENVCYPNTKGVKIIDLGVDKRQYSSIRIGDTTDVDMNNSDLLDMTEAVQKEILSSIKKPKNKPVLKKETEQKKGHGCKDGNCGCKTKKKGVAQ